MNVDDTCSRPWCVLADDFGSCLATKHGTTFGLGRFAPCSAAHRRREADGTFSLQQVEKEFAAGRGGGPSYETISLWKEVLRFLRGGFAPQAACGMFFQAQKLTTDGKHNDMKVCNVVMCFAVGRGVMEVCSSRFGLYACTLVVCSCSLETFDSWFLLLPVRPGPHLTDVGLL